MKVLQKKRIILASSSPRRRDILKDMGLDFEVVVGNADESQVTARSAKELVKRLSTVKVMACFVAMQATDETNAQSVKTSDKSAENIDLARAYTESVDAECKLQNDDFIGNLCNDEEAVVAKYANIAVIGADTVVARKNKIYGKPLTRDKAIEMIGELNGKWHSVYTGVTVLALGVYKTFCVKSRVKFKSLSKAEIEKYVDECQPLDKAGAYGIQDKRIVEKYKGSYTNIVGLPKEKLAKVLERVGVIDECN